MTRILFRRGKPSLVVMMFLASFFLNTVRPVVAFPKTLAATTRSTASFFKKRLAHTEAFDTTLFGPFDEGSVKISRTAQEGPTSFSLYYRMYNKNNNKKEATGQENTSPLVVLHGGPSLPSQYLYPLVTNLEPIRPIIFYDQLGCGRSDEPNDVSFYSIEQSVEDLDNLLAKLCCTNNDENKVHLFGHSYGGALAYEFAKRRPDSVRSLILCNAASDMKLAGDSYDRMALQNPQGFWVDNVCKVQHPALDDALRNVGSVWAGMDVVIDYKASPPPTLSHPLPNTLVMICKHDFGLEASQGWKDLLLDNNNSDGGGNTVEEVCLESCAHYPHLEEGTVFGKILDEFMARHD